MADRPTTSSSGRFDAADDRYEFLAYRVRDVMSQPVTVPAHLTLRDVEQVFEKHGFNALPVVDDAGRLIVVSPTKKWSYVRQAVDTDLYARFFMRPVFGS